MARSLSRAITELSTAVCQEKRLVLLGSELQGKDKALASHYNYISVSLEKISSVEVIPRRTMTPFHNVAMQHLF